VAATRRPVAATPLDMRIAWISRASAPWAFFGNLCAEKAQG
jgi:hypothetical protein